MSARPVHVPARAAALLLRLYPAAWQARYGAEMAALLEDDPPSVRGLGSLLAGATDAHLRPRAVWRTSLSPLIRTRVSVCGSFCCWIALSLMGAGFQQETEDGSFSLAARHHPLLAGARDAILAGATLGALAIAIGGLPLVWYALRTAYQRRDRRLLAALALPVVALACFRGLIGLLVAVAPARHGHFPAAFVLGAAVPWLLGTLLCAGACALAPRLALARTQTPSDALRRASTATVPLAVAMALVTGGLIAYELGLLLQAPELSAQSSGPVGASTGAMLAAQTLLAAAAAALGVIGARRARRAAAVLI